MNNPSNQSEYNANGGNRTPGSGDHYYLFNSFRAWLHTVITAEQFGQTKCLPALPGSQTENYCLALAKLPGNVLAEELARPANAIIAQINRAAMHFHRRQLHHETKATGTDNAANEQPQPSSNRETDVRCQADVRREADVRLQLDFALALILRNLLSFARLRARQTQCPDLLSELIYQTTSGSSDTITLIKRYQQLCPEGFHSPDLCQPNASQSPVSGNNASLSPRERAGVRGNDALPDRMLSNPLETSENGGPSGEDFDLWSDFVWDTYQRVEALDRLADEFPASLRLAAREMHGWPMLIHRHHGNQTRAQELADRLELGINYPLDASETAGHRPDTPMARYLDLLVHHLSYLRNCAPSGSADPTPKNLKTLCALWREVDGDHPSAEVTALLPVIATLPPLTKSTAAEWTEKALVPLIMATDARDWENCTDPALKSIANQSGVKSAATFKSRLHAAVSSSLHRLARPD